MSKTTSLRLDAHLGKSAIFDMLTADVMPSKKSKKGGAKGSIALLKESVQLGCVSQNSYQEKIRPTRRKKIGIKSGT